jgi:hypothetical protein
MIQAIADYTGQLLNFQGPFSRNGRRLANSWYKMTVTPQDWNRNCWYSARPIEP